jgi:hypothetical protein
VPWDAPGSTAIVVMTPEAEPIIGDFYSVHSDAGADGMTTHITLLVPFVPAPELDPAVDARLRGVLRGFEPFEYALKRVERFEDGTLYLAPEPSRPFVDLVLALMREFPAYSPYDGVHDEVIPHLTIADRYDDQLLVRITTEIEPRLPIGCRATEATLVERGTDRRWRARAPVPFGPVE